jgi:outer membrane protein assembly factor BamB
MKISRNKTMATLIALFLTSTIAAMLVVSPAVNAYELQYRPMFIFVAASPDPVGVGQRVMIVAWTSEMAMPSDIDATLGAYGGRECWTGVSLTITKPDGTVQTITLGPSDPVGSNFYSFVPEQVGTYSVTAHFPGQWKNRTASLPWGSSSWVAYPAGSYYFEAADSEPATFIVQEEQLQYIPGVALPSEYWTRPINSYNREWSQIAGNWITGSREDPYITTPDSAHVMWAEPYFFGGIAGGSFTDISFYEGTSYEGKFSGATIIGGILFYNENLGSSTLISASNIVARDLRTGEQLWRVNGSRITGSYIYLYYSRNQHGVHPYLIASRGVSLDPRFLEVPRLSIVDPWSGTEMFTYTDVPSGTVAIGPNGEYMKYVLGGPTSGNTMTERPTTNVTYLALWNISAPVSMTGINSAQLAHYYATGELLGTGYDQYRPVGKEINGTDAYSWNVTVPAGLRACTFNIAALEDRIIAGEGWMQFGIASVYGHFNLWAMGTAEGNRGQLLWNIWIKPPVANMTLQFNGASQCSLEDGIFLVRVKEARTWMAFDINTGKYLWTTEPEPQWMMYSSSVNFYNGKFYTGGYGGEVYCYDAATGERLWTAAVDLEELESAYVRSPLSLQIYDGKVFARSSEHSFSQPYYRTWKMYCFDAETGDRIWDLNGGWYGTAFSDGYMVGLNVDDQLIYSIGKGPSATTVSASPKVSVNGGSVLVEGMVTDEAAGTKSDRIAPRFPNGVPAVSDDSMTAYMQYVYMQMPKPTNTTGVEVVLSVLDPNNNYYEVGRTTSDASGMYRLSFTPEVPGEYTVFASFEGSSSYWPSQAETAINVENAPAATPAPTPTPASIADMYFVPVSIGIIIAIIVVGLLLFLLLRKR